MAYSHSTQASENYQCHVSPAGMGTGKSTFALALIAALIRVDLNYTAAFVVPTIEVAQTAYDSLLKMLQKEEVAV